MNKCELFLPPYLQSLGYAELPEMRELSSRAVTISTEAIHTDPIWGPWREIFEYVCCVEHSRELIINLPKGRAIGSADVVPARYHSASLVFFAQATLDNIAVWSSNRIQLAVKGSDCAFHKTKFNLALAGNSPTAAASVRLHEPFIKKLESYRQEWIHRLTGGASIYSDKPPTDPGSNIQIMVPINPSIGQYEHDHQAYIKAVARTQTKNGGKWLYPVEEFANEMADGLKAFIVSFLAAALADARFTQN